MTTNGTAHPTAVNSGPQVIEDNIGLVSAVIQRHWPLVYEHRSDAPSAVVNAKRAIERQADQHRHWKPAAEDNGAEMLNDGDDAGVRTILIDTEHGAAGIEAGIGDLTPTSELYAEFFEEGLIGLVRAAGRYDHARAKFSTYAWHRIEGAIRDYIRRTLTARTDRPYAREPEPDQTEIDALVYAHGPCDRITACLRCAELLRLILLIPDEMARMVVIGRLGLESEWVVRLLFRSYLDYAGDSPVPWVGDVFRDLQPKSRGRLCDELGLSAGTLRGIERRAMRNLVADLDRHVRVLGLA